jgi:membrane-bound lytic murein transglycosylase A
MKKLLSNEKKIADFFLKSLNIRQGRIFPLPHAPCPLPFKSYHFLCFFLLVLTLLAYSCVSPPISKEEAVGPQSSLFKLKGGDLPHFSDSLDRESFSVAAARDLHYLKKLPPDRTVYFGEDARTVGEMIESIDLFLEILEKEKSKDGLNRALLSNFDVYQPPPVGKNAEPVLFTGYYEPVIEGSSEQTDIFRYPLYRKPGDMVSLNLGVFHPRYKGMALVGRFGDGSFLPYHTREAIDGQAALSGNGLELVWLADPVDLFFLQIQGSGKIRLRDGRTMNVNYAASNGREYKSIGNLFIKEGILPKEEVNLDSIKTYLREHPKEQKRILNYNESYVFFREVDEGPIGCLSEPVTAGRSIATDSSLFPKGALGFIETQIPVVDAGGKLKGWEKTSRFVLNQDTGGAIKGPNRVDLFFGSGDEAGKGAGFMNKGGRLYFLIKKPQKS